VGHDLPENFVAWAKPRLYPEIYSGGGCFLPSILSLSFLSYFLFSFVPPPLSRSDPTNLAKGFRSAVNSLRGTKNGICSHQTLSPGSKYTKSAFVAPLSVYLEGNVSGGWKCHFLYIKRNLKIKANVVVPES